MDLISELLMHQWEGYLCVFCAYTVHRESTYIILFLTQHIKSQNYDKNDDLHAPTPDLMQSIYILLVTSQLIADDVTTTVHD